MEPGLWETAVAEAHAALALSFASEGIEVRSEREQGLVNAAVQAGVLGALAALRQDEDHPDGR